MGNTIYGPGKVYFLGSLLEHRCHVLLIHFSYVVISLGFLCSGVTRCVLWYKSYVSDLNQQVSYAELLIKLLKPMT